MIKWEDIQTNKSSGQVKVKCPSCSETRSNKQDRSLSVNLDKGIAKCHYCEEIAIRDYKEIEKPVSYDLPPQEWQNFTHLSEPVVKYFEGRGISQRTIIDCKVTEELHYQPAIQKEVKNIVFNYFEGDTLINKKYRSADKKFTQSKNTKNIFYGINDIIGEKEVYIVEGEMDKLSLFEYGIKNCISVPNGANDNDDVWKNCEAYLSEVETFYIATDNDSKGNDVAEKIAQRLGRWRCQRIEFTGKDANDDLISNDLPKAINNPKRYPVSGTFTTSDLYDDLLKLYDTGLPETIKPKSIWLKGLEEKFSVMRGHLVVGTGIPSHGKSTFTDWYVMNLIHEYGMKGSWFSPEHSPLELHQSNFAKLFTGKGFWGDNRMSKQELKDYKDWSTEKIYQTYVEPGVKPTWSWLLERFKEQMYSYGIDIFVIDAFNKVLFDRTGNKLDLINEVLTELTSFAQSNNVIIFLVAHPTKMYKNDEGEYPCPTLYDVSGSADFRNQTHDGYAIHRHFPNEAKGEEGHTQFVNLKTKFQFQGDIGSVTKMKYHADSGRLYTEGYGYTDLPLVMKSESQTKLDGGYDTMYPPEWD